MARFLDVAVGMVLGVIGTGVVAALADAPTMDPVKLSPQYYRVRLDNARVRVLEYHLRSGEKETMHRHPEGVVFALANATLKNTFPDGSVTTRRVAQGDVEWSDAVTHTGENVAPPRRTSLESNSRAARSSFRIISKAQCPELTSH